MESGHRDLQPKLREITQQKMKIKHKFWALSTLKKSKEKTKRELMVRKLETRNTVLRKQATTS